MKVSNILRAAVASISCSLGVLAFSIGANAATLTPVDLELSLLVDVSGSIDNNEFGLQQQGYFNAFSNPDLYNNFIGKGQLGKIAANIVYWSSDGQQQESVGWTLIDSVASSQDFATKILNATRPFFGSTAPGSAIAFTTPSFSNNQFDGARKVIDISGDGEENDGLDTATARDNALRSGVNAINGIVIGGDPAVKAFYENEVIGGTNTNGNPAFVFEAQDFQQFGSVIDKKLRAEIAPNPPTKSVPEPTSVLSFLAIGGFGIAGVIKRKSQLVGC